MSLKEITNASFPSIEELEVISGVINRFFSNKKKPLFSFLSGSIAEGIGTPNSDYDVYAVFDTCDEAEVLVVEESDRPIEITSIPLSKLENVLSYIQSGIDLANATNYQLLLCHRVYSGIALTQPSKFYALQEKFNVNIFRARLVELCFLNTERSLKVCNGFLLIGDKCSASLSANNAIRHSFNMLLAMKGATSILEKWQMRYAAKFLGEGHLALSYYLELISHIPCHLSQQIDFYIQRVKNFHQLVCDYRMIEGRMADAEFFVEPRISLAEYSSAPMVVSKTKLSRVVSSESKFYLVIDATPVLELPKSAAFLWALIDRNATITELILKAEKIIDLPPSTSFEYLKAFGSARAINIINFDFNSASEVLAI